MDSGYPTDAKAETLLAMDKVLGLGLESYVSKPVEIPEDIQILLNDRAAARMDSNWAESDRIRDELKDLGWTVEDSTEGQRALPIDRPGPSF